MVWTGVVSVFLAFFFYLLTGGAGLARASAVMFRAALLGLGMAVAMAALPVFLSAKIAAAVFTHFAIAGCVMGLMMYSLRIAGDHLVAKSSPLEVVCLNVLAVSFGGAPDSFAFFDMLAEMSYFLLINPLGFLVPEDMPWLRMPLSLGPSVIAIWAATFREHEGRGIRLLLIWWVQLLYATWVVPASVAMLAHPGEASGYVMVDLLLAMLGLVRSIMTLFALRLSLWGSTTNDDYGARGTTAKTLFRQRFIDAMVISPMPVWAYAVAGIAVFALANVARHWLPADVAVTSGFFTILAITATIEEIRRRMPAIHSAGERAEPMAGSPIVAVTLLTVGLSVLQTLPLLPRYVPAVVMGRAPESVVAAPTPGETPPAITIVDPVIDSVSRDVPLACRLEPGMTFRCAAEVWPLRSLAHPVRMRIPGDVHLPANIYGLKFDDIDVRCVEYPVTDESGEVMNVLLIVFLANASLPEQVGWTVDPEARCHQLRARFRDAEPTILRGRGGEDFEEIATLRRHAILESELPL